MMRKDIRYFMMGVALAAVALSGCSQFEEENLFSESAAQRIVHYNEDLQARLVEQSSNGNNGWLIQYFVASEYEGFNLFGRFNENGKVTLASDHRFLRGGNAGNYTEDTSFYEMLREEGSVLAFNTWNDVLTVLVDPVSPSDAPKTILPDGVGLQGDQNLVFESNEEDGSIMFHGERNLAKVRFVPCDRPWETYIDDTKDTKKAITNTTITTYYVVCGTDTLYFKNLHKGIITYFDRIEDPMFSSTLTCVFTPTGFRLQYPDSIADAQFQEFSLASDKSCLLSEDEKVKVIAMWDYYIVNSRGTTWNFDQDKLTDEQKSLLALINAELKKAFDNTFNITSVGLGKGKTVASASPGPLIVFDYSYTSKGTKKKSSIGIAVTTSMPTFGQMVIKVSPDDSVDSNMDNFFTRSGGSYVESLVRQFAATFDGTYSIVPDDYFLPTGCELRAIGGGNNYSLKQP